MQLEQLGVKAVLSFHAILAVIRLSFCFVILEQTNLKEYGEGKSGLLD
jgi:hypothetical protein